MPDECRFIANLMFGLLAIQSTLPFSGSDSSDGPAYVPLVQLDDAPEKPSKRLYWS